MQPVAAVVPVVALPERLCESWGSATHAQRASCVRKCRSGSGRGARHRIKISRSTSTPSLPFSFPLSLSRPLSLSLLALDVWLEDPSRPSWIVDAPSQYTGRALLAVERHSKWLTICVRSQSPSVWPRPATRPFRVVVVLRINGAVVALSLCRRRQAQSHREGHSSILGFLQPDFDVRLTVQLLLYVNELDVSSDTGTGRCSSALTDRLMIL